MDKSEMELLNEEFLYCDYERSKELISLGCNPHYVNNEGMNAYFFQNSFFPEKFSLLQDNNVEIFDDALIDTNLTVSILYHPDFKHLKPFLTPVNLFNPDFLRKIIYDEDKITLILSMILNPLYNAEEYYEPTLYEDLILDLELNTLSNIVLRFDEDNENETYLHFFIRNQRRILLSNDNPSIFNELINEEEIFLKKE
ncbi:hypothetical protein JK211_14530 [Tatumella sp. JGM130]|uniref:hypothetical protein n=1 Tax=Tatumella sp. JGM130 TaxID=2799797 RepID=UPI001BB0C240|nr:hypothetical protein [Tatumella sp. JGM130]MBS0895231.1 hypothetical protein [Tatumella sp. JGM130]